MRSRKPLLHVERPRVGQCEPSRGGDMGRARRFALAVVACGVLAGCGVSTPAGPPSARALAHKIPGCGGITAGTLSDMKVQDVTCTLQDGAPVEIGAFANASDERQWINSGGDPASPDSFYAGCCIQGSSGPPLSDSTSQTGLWTWTSTPSFTRSADVKCRDSSPSAPRVFLMCE
jgi:hypothetical protein